MSHSLPHFTIQWHFDQSAPQLAVEEGIFPQGQDNALMIGEMNMRNLIEVYEGSLSVAVIGSPIIDDQVDRKKTAAVLADAGNVMDVVGTLGGEFLILTLDRSKRELCVYTDRFSSYPLYWARNDREFIGSYLYLDAARHCKTWLGFALRPEKAYEFFVLQRLMASGTHDTLTQFMPAASRLCLKGGQEPEITAYWQASYKKNDTASRTELGEQFVKLFSHSMHVRLRDQENKNFGVFLSGGHDSRLVAAYADRPVTCYTLGFTDNLEVDCARQISEEIGQDHVFQLLDDGYFLKTLEDSSYMSGGMYALDHALFLPVEGSSQPASDVYLHGHGLDYMYQGMYLHARARKIFGRHTFLKQQLELPADLSDHFIKGVSFRLKYDHSQIFCTDTCEIQGYQEQLYKTVKLVEEEGREKQLDQHQLWEYLIFHQPSRHYTFSNIMSKRACGEVRTPTFDNALFDFYRALPDKFRLHSDILCYAMRKHASKIANIPAGNHGAPAGWGPWRKTGAIIFRKLLKEITGSTRFAMPAGADRTWPERGEYMKAHPDYWQAMLAPLKDETFKGILDFIDWDKLGENPEFILEEEHGGSFMVSLLSYYLFYKQLYQ